LAENIGLKPPDKICQEAVNMSEFV